MKTSDKTQVQQYLNLFHQFINNLIITSEFQTLFIKMRREDKYWMSGYFDSQLDQILNTLFLDIDEYTPVDLHDEKSKFEINETELFKRVKEASIKIETLIS